MSDLLALVPAIKIKFYIISPKTRQEKVLSEMSRPTFQKIGLSEYCKFISIEDIEKLYEQISGLEGHLTHSIIDKYAIGLEDDSETSFE